MMSCTWRPVRSFGSTFRLVGARKVCGRRDDGPAARLCEPRGICADAEVTRTAAVNAVMNVADRGLNKVFTEGTSQECALTRWLVSFCWCGLLDRNSERFMLQGPDATSFLSISAAWTKGSPRSGECLRRSADSSMRAYRGAAWDQKLSRAAGRAHGG